VSHDDSLFALRTVPAVVGTRGDTEGASHGRVDVGISRVLSLAARSVNRNRCRLSIVVVVVVVVVVIVVVIVVVVIVAVIKRNGCSGGVLHACRVHVTGTDAA
jgi:hypothetical protein